MPKSLRFPHWNLICNEAFYIKYNILLNVLSQIPQLLQLLQSHWISVMLYAYNIKWVTNDSKKSKASLLPLGSMDDITLCFILYTLYRHN